MWKKRTGLCFWGVKKEALNVHSLFYLVQIQRIHKTLAHAFVIAYAWVMALLLLVAARWVCIGRDKKRNGQTKESNEKSLRWVEPLKQTANSNRCFFC
jgi:hypothetical protein